jgi:hypothetical protein
MQFFKWIAENWQAVCSWATAFYIIYRIGLVFTRFVKFLISSADRIQEWEDTLRGVDGSLQLMTGNHLPHIQAELEKMNQTFSELREDLRLLLADKILRDDDR